MQDLAARISGELLPYVTQPVQYVGLEHNARRADVRGADVSVAMAFPDTYEIGISHLGSQILYHMLNDSPGVACDRCYCPRIDAEQVMRAAKLPLFGWESRAPLAEFDVVGFSLAYEMCATNVLTMLDLAGIPLRSAERDAAPPGAHPWPLVIAGDAMADTPEPMAAFIDAFVVGDGERPLAALVELVRRCKASDLPRRRMLLEAARTIPSLYVPAFYRPRFGAAGRQIGVEPVEADLPETVSRAVLGMLSDSPAVTRPLVPLMEGVHDRVVVEIMRGCPNACRFCQAGATRLPVRTRSVEEIVAIARQALAATGYDEVSLLSLSTSDYPCLGELIDRLNAAFAGRHVSISLPSLRVDSQLRHLPKLTSQVRKAGLTIAAEAGSQRLRDAIGKRVTEQDMLAGVRGAYQAGWNRVKVYFMAGLPGETADDIDAIADLCKRLSQTGREFLGHPGAINASVSWFVPKPHTPMQWCGMMPAEYCFAVRNRLRDLARRSAVNFRFHHIERSIIEAAIVRGGREVADAIEAAWRAGARMDAWNEHFDHRLWERAFAAVGLDAAELATRDLPTDEDTPWSHVASPRGCKFLLAEYEHLVSAR
jgi:radical SAM family uncharacterized protein